MAWDRTSATASISSSTAPATTRTSSPTAPTKVLKKGALFRFEAHYHPYGEQTFDRLKVGIKFYPKGVVPKYVVTSHRIRTGVGKEWVLNRERVEDLLLRAGHKLSIDEPAMPTGALIAENPLHGAALSEHSAKYRRAPRPLTCRCRRPALDHQLPAAHALPRFAHAARSDSS